MSYTVFARKYRPQTFDDVVGQEHITRTLKNAIEQNRLAHAYIFVGPRGTGKTSTARILAKALNCQSSPGPTVTPCGECDACREIAAGTSMDVLEFDAASNTQVDKVRELIIDNVKYAPSRGRYKVYIVDEVHMLSTSSFNALLKTLEEPPEHVKFVFATTDVQKVPTTILSRCQRFDLKRIPIALIAKHLQQIAEFEKIALMPEAAEAVARGAEGGMRDAESMLDQLVAFCGDKIDEGDVQSVFGFTAQQTVSTLCDHLIAGNAALGLSVVHEQAEAGRDLSRLMADLITHLRNLLVTQADPAGLANELTSEALAALTEQTAQIPMEKLLELIEQFAGAEQRMKWASNKKMHFEIAVIRGIQTLNQATLSEVLDTLAAMRGGTPAPEIARTPAPATRPKAPAPAPARPSRVPAKLVVTKVSETTPAGAPSAPVVESAPEPVQEKAVPAVDPVSITPVSPAPEPSSEESAAVTEALREAAEPPVAPPVAERPATETLAPPEKPITKPKKTERPKPEAESASPAAATETTTAAPPATGDLWPRLVAEVRRQRPLIAMWVEAGTLLDIQGDTAIAGFPSDQGLAADYCQQPNNRKFLESLLSEFSGRPISLKCQVREGLVVTPPPAPEPEAPRDPMSEFKDDPLIQKALEIFKAEIQPA